MIKIKSSAELQKMLRSNEIAAQALALADPALPRPAPHPPVLAPGPDDPRDRDLAHLLNVPLPYRRGGDSHARIRGLDLIVINDYRKFADAVGVWLK